MSRSPRIRARMKRRARWLHARRFSWSADLFACTTASENVWQEKPLSLETIRETLDIMAQQPRPRVYISSWLDKSYIMGGTHYYIHPKHLESLGDKDRVAIQEMARSTLIKDSEEAIEAFRMSYGASWVKDLRAGKI